ncbi:MAG: hypothetical protein ABIJ18_01575 [archaeon]
MVFYYAQDFTEDSIIAENLVATREYVNSAELGFEAVREEIDKGLDMEPFKVISLYKNALADCVIALGHRIKAQRRFNYFREKGIDHLIS